MEYEEIELNCFCGKTFIWTPGEQEFLDSLYEQGKVASVIQPKRCVDCRLKKKEEREKRGY